jgi:N-acetylglucosaminyldiphosphoundecaprenol N-acetyl-beta-D-mannosaminyltransferase
LPIYLFGSTTEMLTKLQDRLTEKFASLRIVGSRPSAFRQLTQAERDTVVQEIRASGAKIVFVGLGCPRQEVFAFEMRDLVGMPLLAVGAAFSFHAGILPQAPPTMQRWGLEWMYRLVQEPRRLWKRYVLLNPLYLTLLGLQKSGLWNGGKDHVGQPLEELRYG